MYSHWMLKPESSGGGCLISSSPHFIDLALTFMPFEPDIVFSRIDNGLHETAVEDAATLIMTSKSGGQAMVQTDIIFQIVLSKENTLSAFQQKITTCNQVKMGLLLYDLGSRQNL